MHLHVEKILNSTEYISNLILKNSRKRFHTISTKAVDSTEEIIGCQLPKQCPTRWNSIFDCLRVLLNINEKQLNDLCVKLLIPQLDDEDYLIFSEYVSIMQPISIYLDLLQGETNCFLGIVLPSILKIRSILESLELSYQLISYPPSRWNFHKAGL